MILEGIFLEMLGSTTPLALQEPRRAMVSTLVALKASLDASGLTYREGPFQSIIVNDEYVWENYGIPMSSLSRFPYPEYHSSFDTVERISEVALQEAVGVLMDTIDRLESAPLLIKKFQGISASPILATIFMSTQVKWRLATAPQTYCSGCAA